MRLLSPRRKRPTERLPIGLNFSDELESGDAAAAPEVTAAIDAVDVTSACVEAVQLLAPATVACTLKGGAAGDSIVVAFTLTTAAGYRYQHDVVFDVRDDA